METAGAPKSKQNMQMPISVSAKWLGYANKITQMAAGLIVSPLTSQIGKSHGTTNSTSEIHNHNRRSALNRVSAIKNAFSLLPNDLALSQRHWQLVHICNLDIQISYFNQNLNGQRPRAPAPG